MSRGSALKDALAALLPATSLTEVDPQVFEPARAPVLPEGFDGAARDAATRAAAALLAYVGTHQPFALRQAERLRHYALADAMVLDAATRSHLELFESSEDRSRRGTLIACIDRTRTPLGARRIVRFLAYPLVAPLQIEARQEAVAWLSERDRLRSLLRDALGGVRDLERQLAKVARPSTTPRDLAALRASLRGLPAVVSALEFDDGTRLSEDGAPRPRALPQPRAVPAACALLDEGLVEDPPALPRGSRGALETGYIREVGYRPELDGLRESARKGREWIAGFEARERERTGIGNLRVRFHPVHGYSLEVTKSQLDRVPEGYERKQTLASAERFTTAELRGAEQAVLGARERAAALEREIFEELRQAALAHAPEIRSAADSVAELDALASLAEVARMGGLGAAPHRRRYGSAHRGRSASGGRSRAGLAGR